MESNTNIENRLTPLSSNLLAAAPTLEDVIIAVMASDLPPDKIRRISADIRIVAGWLTRRPLDIAAHPGVLRNKLSKLHHKELGISAKRLANIRSNLRRGLEMVGHINDRPNGKPIEALTGPWRDLWDLIAGSWQAPQLSQFIRYCAVHGIAPQDVTDLAFNAWGAWRADGTASIARDPNMAVTKGRRAWINCVATVPGWPQQIITPEYRRVRVTRDLTEFPQSFGDDLALFRSKKGVSSAPAVRQRFRNAAGINDHNDLSSSKIDRCIDALLLAATTAVDEKIMRLDEVIDICSILTLYIATATLVKLEDRNGLSEYLLTVAKNLKCVAGRWLVLSEYDTADWADVVDSVRGTLKDEIGFNPNGMTQRNRQRLAQFTDPQVVSRLFSYPWAVFDELEIERHRKHRVNDEMGLRAMSAVAVVILTTLPLRRGTLHLLKWDHHIMLPPKRGLGRLSVSAHEVKNNRDLAAPLTQDMVSLLRIFRQHYWPVLTDHSDNPHIFPAARGLGPRSRGQLATNIVTRIKSHSGLTMNLHLFRHLMATLAFTKIAEAGDMDKGATLVESLLGLAPGSKVRERYSETKSSSAAEWMDNNVAQLHRPRVTSRAKREWQR